MKTTNTESLTPVKPAERYLLLDALRGLTLLGICLANYPEFSLYTFQGEALTRSMPTADIDWVIRYFLYILVDGKFYTLFSLLFGIGFSIIIANATQKQKNGFKLFYRRMSVLMMIGFLHLMFIWSGDILLLYAVLGLILPLFRNVSNRGLLISSSVLLLFPVVVDALTVWSGVNPAAGVIGVQQYFCRLVGIDDANFGTWLRDADSYAKVFDFLMQGAFVRMQEFIEGNRAFKVLGLFVLGFYIGRNRIYANLEANKRLLKRVAAYGFLIGLPTSLVFAWSALHGHPWGLIAHSAIYTISVVPLGLAYGAAICLWYQRKERQTIFKYLAAPGKMALTNYVGQSVLGMFLFYGIGWGWGADMGLVNVELIAIGVYLLQMVCSYAWLSYCQFGPLEWGWRMLTYGKWLRLERT